MQGLEKILKEMRKIKDGNRKEKLYAKYPPNGKDQEVLNAYSQGYEDGTDNFYNATVDIIRKHMADDSDGWVPVEERLPEGRKEVLVQWEFCSRCDNMTYTYIHIMRLNKMTGEWNGTYGVPNGKVIAWRPLPELYRPERNEE